MKKSAYILSAAIMCLAIIVGTIGITAAWFANSTESSQIVEITSQQPSPKVSIVADSLSNTASDGAVLSPAKFKAGYLQKDFAGSGSYDTLAVPYINDLGNPVLSGQERVTANPIAPSTVLDTANSLVDPRPFYQAATSVTVEFTFKYSGAPTVAQGSYTPLAISMTYATLKNTRYNVLDESEEVIGTESDLGSQVNYAENIGLYMVVTCEDTVGQTTLESQEQTEHVLYLNVKSNAEYTITITIFFSKGDEELPPELLDTSIWFNFELTKVDP